jgi:hypothetical protein
LGQTGSVNNQRVSLATVDYGDEPATGSTYVPIDSWIYPALDRLQALGYINYAYTGLRPWTRSSITHMLNQTAEFQDFTSSDEQAYEIYLAVRKELNTGTHTFADLRHPRNSFESAYTRLGGITGTPLRDSFHLGLTIVNDYGRPYQRGFQSHSRLQYAKRSWTIRSLFQRGISACSGRSRIFAVVIQSPFDHRSRSNRNLSKSIDYSCWADRAGE